MCCCVRHTQNSPSILAIENFNAVLPLFHFPACLSPETEHPAAKGRQLQSCTKGENQLYPGLSDKAGRCLMTLGSSRGLQSWFDGWFWIPLLDIMKRMDRDWVPSSFSKKRKTPRPRSVASRNQVQNKKKKVISHTVVICEIPWQRSLWMRTVCTGWRENENNLKDSSIEDCQ